MCMRMMLLSLLLTCLLNKAHRLLPAQTAAAT